MQRYLLLALGMVASVPPASAADEFIKGVYLQSEELCTQARKDGLQTVIEAGNIVLTWHGLESIEYNCEFLNVTKATRAPAWAVTAICQSPGNLFPDVLSVTEMNATQIDLASVRPAEADDSDSINGGSYYLCEDVDAP
jgi:hypothetical protein